MTTCMWTLAIHIRNPVYSTRLTCLSVELQTVLFATSLFIINSLIDMCLLPGRQSLPSMDKRKEKQNHVNTWSSLLQLLEITIKIWCRKAAFTIKMELHVSGVKKLNRAGLRTKWFALGSVIITAFSANLFQMLARSNAGSRFLSYILYV